MREYKLLVLNCQKAYQPTLDTYLRHILLVGRYDFLILQEVDSKVASIIRSVTSVYQVLDEFDSVIDQTSHVRILYNHDFRLKTSRYVSFANLDPKFSAKGWGFIVGVFSKKDCEIAIGSIHLHPGINRQVRHLEVCRAKEVLSVFHGSFPIVFGGDFNASPLREKKQWDRLLFPSYFRVTRSMKSTLDSRYTEKGNLAITKFANFLGKFGLAIKLKVDQVFADSTFLLPERVRCTVLPDRVSDHSPIDISISFNQTDL